MEYSPQQFLDLFRTDIGVSIWEFLLAKDNVIRMETASFLGRPAVEPLSPYLLGEYGDDIRERRTKQMIGHMVRQIMEERGYQVARSGMRITRKNLFASGTRYVGAIEELQGTIMKERQDKTFGRYRVIGGVINSKPKAVAYLGTRKILDCEGADVSEAIATVEAALNAREHSRQQKRREPHIGTVSDYEEAFERIKLGDHEYLMLRAHANAPQQTMTASEIAEAAGFDSYVSANSHYGKLAKKVGDASGLRPPVAGRKNELIYTFILATGEREEGDDWRWTMHPEVLEALRTLKLG